ncbi:hypothetical protein [Ensifer aridi]|uniref:hypothetical protein n=1 Tax=Ensifer aridi TaxID=1708715 RepID=UPI000A122415|nr:hypothetical protein [Ensifer aridi]
MTNEVMVIDSGSKQYWDDLGRAWALVRDLEFCLQRTKTAPLYIGRYVGDDGEMHIIENLGPWDDLADAQARVKADWMAMRIIEANSRENELLS